MNLTNLPRDIHSIIFKLLNVDTLGRFARVNVYFRNLININGENSPFVSKNDRLRRIRCARLRNNNPLEFIFENFSGLRRYSSISAHPCMTFELFVKYSRKMLFNQHVTRNPNITIDMLIDLMKIYGYRSHEYILGPMSVITIDEMERNNIRFIYKSSLGAFTFQDYFNHTRDRWNTFMSCGKINITDIEKNPSLAWDYTYLICNQQIPSDALLKLRNGTKPFRAEICRYCTGDADESIAMQYEKMVMQQKCDLDANLILLCSQYFSIRTILEHDDVLWDWAIISQRCGHSIPVNFIINNRHLPWQYQNMHLVLRSNNIDLSLKYHGMYEASILTIDDILTCNTDHHNVTWDWTRLAGCMSLSVSDLIKHGPVNNIIFMDKLSNRKDITPQILVQYSRLKWSLITLVTNIS